MESMVEYIQLCVQDYFKAAQIEVSCYGHSFQSKDLAVCVLALNGGSVGDVTDIRIALATLAPSPIPLVIVHVPSAGQPCISVGDLAMEHCVMWEAQTEAGLHCLNLYLGETFGIYSGFRAAVWNRCVGAEDGGHKEKGRVIGVKAQSYGKQTDQRCGSLV